MASIRSGFGPWEQIEDYGPLRDDFVSDAHVPRFPNVLVLCMGAANESALLVRGYHRRHCAVLGTDDHEHQGSGLQVLEGLVLPDVGDDVHEFVHAPDLYLCGQRVHPCRQEW